MSDASRLETAIGQIVDLKARLAAADAENERLNEALHSMEEPCTDCGGAGCNWCGQTGLTLKDASKISAILRAALAAAPDGES